MLHHVTLKYVHLESRKPFKHHCIICSTTVLQIPIILDVSVGFYSTPTYDLVISLVSTFPINAIFLSEEARLALRFLQ